MAFFTRFSAFLLDDRNVACRMKWKVASSASGTKLLIGNSRYMMGLCVVNAWNDFQSTFHVRSFAEVAPVFSSILQA